MSARRGGRTVHEQSFDLGPGDDLVLTALDDARYEAEDSPKIRALRLDETPRWRRGRSDADPDRGAPIGR
jgi:hypothetical protein